MMKKINVLLLAILILTSCTLSAQVAITTDGSDPDGSAMLDVQSDDKGFLAPRVASTADVDSPVTGLLVYQTGGTAGFYYYDGTAWVAQVSSKHYVGELYGGGVVYWVDYTGQHGLIVSMVYLSIGQAWSDVSSTLIGASAQSDWDGPGNSNAIIGQNGHTSSAAKLCLDYTNADYGTGTYSDWYLPSRGELNHLWNNIYDVQKALNGASATEITKFYRALAQITHFVG